METSSKYAILLALVCSVALVHGYRTEAPDFSNEPLTTLAPITAEQQLYIVLLNFVSGNTPIGPAPPLNLTALPNFAGQNFQFPQGLPQGLLQGFPNFPIPNNGQLPPPGVIPMGVPGSGQMPSIPAPPSAGAAAPVSAGSPSS